MKLIIALGALAVCLGAKLDRTYLPPLGSSNSDGSGLLDTPKLTSSGNSIGPQTSVFNAHLPGNQGLGGFTSLRNDLGSDQVSRFNAQPTDHQNKGSNSKENHFEINAPGFSAGLHGNTNGHDFGDEAPNSLNQIEIQDEIIPERPQAAFERSPVTLREENENNGDAFAYLYETENGIFAEESGVAANGVQAQGGYSYTGDDGLVYSISYTADENGFVPQGEHLPTAPPVPEEILRALEENARDEAAGIFDDGSYDESKYGGGDQAHHYNQGTGSEGNPFASQNDANTIATQAAAYLPPNNQFQRNPFGRFASRGNELSSHVSNGRVTTSNGVPRDNENRIGSQTAAYLPPVSNHSRSQGIEDGKRSNRHGPASRSGNGHRPSSYEVPLQSRTPEQGSDATNDFGARIGVASARPSFNPRTGYNY